MIKIKKHPENLAMSTHPIITGIRVRTVQVPMTEPHKTASGVITASPLVLTDILTDTGVIGHSLVFTYTPAALKPTADFIQNLEPLVKGRTLAPLEVEQTLSKKFRLLGTQGLVGMALAAIDMAIWDALARENHTSLTQLLGGTEKPIPAYGGIGYVGALESGNVAEQWAKRGFTGVKAKIGYPTVTEDIAVIRAIRKATHESMAIMVDYNQCLSPTEAVARLRILDNEGLAWVEEPTLAHDYTGHANITRQSRTPIQCGENWWGTLDIQHGIEAAASDYVMPDVMKIGGVSGWLRASALASARGLSVSSHLWPEISARLLCCTPTAHWLEYTDWWNPILKEPLIIEHGQATPSTTPGSGIDWNEEAINRYLV